ncbi:hypothetical protein EYF80_013989 [Liparis tanakae]|uniref:Uncharacterized protein n=1 Tax=Liparis tanakae TaxID=230148 RepID=A0A4Z2IEU3_9TELE|nr:hypothetical protein EYF80_013989 [Liparis tanakae]
MRGKIYGITAAIQTVLIVRPGVCSRSFFVRELDEYEWPLTREIALYQKLSRLVIPFTSLTVLCDRDVHFSLPKQIHVGFGTDCP